MKSPVVRGGILIQFRSQGHVLWLNTVGELLRIIKSIYRLDVLCVLCRTDFAVVSFFL